MVREGQRWPEIVRDDQRLSSMVRSGQERLQTIMTIIKVQRPFEDR